MKQGCCRGDGAKQEGGCCKTGDGSKGTDGSCGPNCQCKKPTTADGGGSKKKVRGAKEKRAQCGCEK